MDALTVNGTRTFHIAADAFDVGDPLVLELGTTSLDVGQKGPFVVASKVSDGSTGMNITVVGGGRSSVADSTNPSNNGGPTKAHAAGATIKIITASDVGGSSGTPLIHPGNKLQRGGMRDQFIAKKSAIKAAVSPYMATLLAA